MGGAARPPFGCPSRGSRLLLPLPASPCAASAASPPRETPAASPPSRGGERRAGGVAPRLRPAPGSPGAPPPAPRRPVPPRPVPYRCPGPGDGEGRAGAMSHGARVIRTGVSSGGPAAPPAAATTASSSAGSDAELMDGAYFRSCAGMLKVAQMISLLVGFISVNNSTWTDYSAYSYFQIVTMCDLVMILFFYIIHIFRIYRKLTCVSWPLAEFLHYLIGTILLLIASIVAASKSLNLTGLVAGATFGFLATILCVLSIWSSYKVSCITQSTNASV
ncbi:CKLF-like MARVEL transmembrane domain-containing protein 7 isoform X1 [Chroicocephalus ridibundus]|uniref:CKLF-like MARVEL transmembrane domain-containing protein 7 isoform X1 n=2 Tax=Chroicocephalus ridibundus TaxID=1192867 RepID=UPI002FDD5889